jgi:diaminohydroxyphosphoribosylaminopyrimidine deaminase/5-amino-6-(5-phosphoribosylamino)uracil reductase
VDDVRAMSLAIAEAERARGTTGDNPWVGCVIVDRAGAIVGRGHTQGPGEDHAEIGAIRITRDLGVVLAGATLYSTLEPCAFHGRTPACAKVVAECGVARVVTAMRDPHPRVDGVGVRMLRDAGLEVIEGVLEDEVRRQLGSWVVAYHPHEPIARARALLRERDRSAVVAQLIALYAIDAERAEQIVARAV